MVWRHTLARDTADNQEIGRELMTMIADLQVHVVDLSYDIECGETVCQAALIAERDGLSWMIQVTSHDSQVLEEEHEQFADEFESSVRRRQSVQFGGSAGYRPNPPG